MVKFEITGRRVDGWDETWWERMIQVRDVRDAERGPNLREFRFVDERDVSMS